MKRWSSSVVLPLVAFAVTVPAAPAAADPSASCSADVCIVSVSEYAPPVSVGALAIGSRSGPSYVGTNAWLADVVTAFQNGTAYVTPDDSWATANQVVGGPADVWLIIGQQVTSKPDGSKVYTGIYRPGNWSNSDFAYVLVTTAPGGASATGSAVHYEIFGETATTYGVTLSPDRKSVLLNAYANGYSLPDGYLEGGLDIESTPDGTTVHTTPQVLP